MPLVGKSASPYITEIIYNTKKKGMVYFNFFVSFTSFLWLRYCIVEEALNHPYMASLHEINEEPTCPTPFIFDFEQTILNEEDIKELIWKESLNFSQDHQMLE